MLTKFKNKIFLSCLILLLCSVSCVKETGNSKIETEIAKLYLSVDTERFDKVLAKATFEDLPKLKADYPFMFSKKYQDTFWIKKIKDTLQKELFNEVNRTFKDFSATEADIESVFKHLKYYFPEFKVPRVITTTSDVDYRNKIIVTDTIALLALDNYLGSDHRFYSGISKYIRADFNKSQIAIDLAGEYAKHYIFQQRKTLLDEMVYFGKILYFKDVMVPFKTDAERIGYSQEQLQWAVNNESYIWRYFVERELLFSTDSKLPGRFINPAPFTKFYLEQIDTDSPGRLGQYIGWQIIRAYMAQNEVSLKTMLATDSETIFNNTKFKPRKE